MCRWWLLDLHCDRTVTCVALVATVITTNIDNDHGNKTMLLHGTWKNCIIARNTEEMYHYCVDCNREPVVLSAKQRCTQISKDRLIWLGWLESHKRYDPSSKHHRLSGKVLCFFFAGGFRTNTFGHPFQDPSSELFRPLREQWFFFPIFLFVVWILFDPVHTYFDNKNK